MQSVLARTLYMASLAFALTPSIGQAMTVVERFDRWTTTFDDLGTFAGALQHTDVRYLNSPLREGEEVNRTYTLANSGYTNIAVSGDENIQTTIQQIVSGTPTTVRSTVKALTGDPGYSILSYDRERTSIILNGQHVFRRSGITATGGVANGFPAIFEFLIEGDWSKIGTAFGSHTLDAINPAWTIDKNFVFDGTYTVLRASIGQYFNDGSHNLDLAYSLYGVAAVPEPRTAVLMLIGLGLAGLLRHSRRGSPGEIR